MNNILYFTPRELKDFNGKSGKPVYIAFKGKIYDVSSSHLWVNGELRGRHVAGGDLSSELINAPHREEIISKFPVIGELREEPLATRLQKRIEGLHFHSMVVHFSITLGILSPSFTVAYLITNNDAFEKAAYYLLILLLISTIGSGLSGLFSWKVTYEGVKSKIFNRKIILTVVLTTLVFVCSGWRIFVPDLLIKMDFASYIYVLLLICIAGVTSALGHYGGKIMFR